MAAERRGALRHFVRVILVLAGVALVYSAAVAGVRFAALESVAPGLLPGLVLRGTPMQAYLTDAWLKAPVQPLFWLASALVFLTYNAFSGDIDPQQ